MLGYKQEKLLYRILSGKTTIKINGSRLDVITPSLDLLYESCEIYEEYVEKSKLLSKQEIKEYLIAKGIVYRKELDFLNKSQGIIENFQKELFINFNHQSADSIRSYIRKTREEEDRIMRLLSKYDTYTKEGLANYAKSIFLIENTTYQDNVKIDFNTSNIKSMNILFEYNNKLISPTQIRDISKNQQWNNMWFGLKGSTIFPEGVSISIEKQLLLMWSKIYDNIKESMECPSDDIIEDNDATDGWILIEKENREKEKVEKINNSDSSKNRFNSKINNSDEVYIIAKSKDEIDRINKMNSEYSTMIKGKRLNQIMEAGVLNHSNLKDVNQDIMMQRTQLEIQCAKSRSR